MAKLDESKEIKALKKALSQEKRKNKALEKKYGEEKLKNKLLKCDSKKKRENCFFPLSQRKSRSWWNCCSQTSTRRNSHTVRRPTLCLCGDKFSSGS